MHTYIYIYICMSVYVYQYIYISLIYMCESKPCFVVCPPAPRYIPLCRGRLLHTFVANASRRYALQKNLVAEVLVASQEILLQTYVAEWPPKPVTNQKDKLSGALTSIDSSSGRRRRCQWQNLSAKRGVCTWHLSRLRLHLFSELSSDGLRLAEPMSIMAWAVGAGCERTSCLKISVRLRLWPTHNWNVLAFPPPSPSSPNLLIIEKLSPAVRWYMVTCIRAVSRPRDLLSCRDAHLGAS